jgi:hypothetical protein
MAKFHYRLRSVRPFWAIASSGFGESTRAQKDPFKDHTFAITESNGEPFKKSIGKVPEPGRLASIRQTSLCQMSQALFQEIGDDGWWQAPFMAESNVSDLSRLRGK